MARWFRVVIRGRYDSRPHDVVATVTATDATNAAYTAVEEEWPGFEVDHDRPLTIGNGRVIRFKLRAAGEAVWHFTTGHSSFEEMATEITDPATLARLDSDPTLSLQRVDCGA